MNSNAAKVILITGVMAAGKSSVARRLPRSVHLRGDVFRRMIVKGRVEMGRTPRPAAMEQLRLRYRAAYEAATLHLSAGFDVVYQDTIVGPVLAEVRSLYRGVTLHVVVLCPRADVVRQREQSRAKTAYHDFTVEEFDAILQNETPRIGLWLGNSEQDPQETAESILAGLDGAAV